MNVINTRVAQISYDKIARIVKKKVVDNSEIELTDCIENYEATKKITQGDKFLSLVDGRDIQTSVSKEARAYTANVKRDGKHIAEALLVNSTAQKLVGNFYINVNKPQIPTKIFSSEEKALEWLNSFRHLTEVNSNIQGKEHRHSHSKKLEFVSS